MGRPGPLAERRRSRSGPPQTTAQLAARGVKRVVVYAQAEDVAALEALEKAWGVGASEAARRAWREAAEQTKAR